MSATNTLLGGKKNLIKMKDKTLEGVNYRNLVRFVTFFGVGKKISANLFAYVKNFV